VVVLEAVVLAALIEPTGDDISGRRQDNGQVDAVARLGL